MYDEYIFSPKSLECVDSITAVFGGQHVNAQDLLIW